MSESDSSRRQTAFNDADPPPSQPQPATGSVLPTPEGRDAEIAVISHELRNSLAVIRNTTRLLRSAPSLNSARALIERHVGYMSRHIDELLQSRQYGSSGIGLICADIDLRTIARHAADAIRPEMARRRHHLVVELPAQPVWARADGARVEQMLSNLLINAAKYTPDGGDIVLALEQQNGGARLRICDSGVGIEPAMLPRVFGLFVQATRSTPARDGGRGIGLAIVRTVVEQHGGTVTATSPGLGLGSEFTIVLPAVRGP